MEVDKEKEKELKENMEKSDLLEHTLKPLNQSLAQQTNILLLNAELPPKLKPFKSKLGEPRLS